MKTITIIILSCIWFVILFTFIWIIYQETKIKKLQSELDADDNESN
jgi:hypothetical protein